MRKLCRTSAWESIEISNLLLEWKTWQGDFKSSDTLRQPACWRLWQHCNEPSPNSGKPKAPTALEKCAAFSQSCPAPCRPGQAGVDVMLAGPIHREAPFGSELISSLSALNRHRLQSEGDVCSVYCAGAFCGILTPAWILVQPWQQSQASDISTGTTAFWGPTWSLWPVQKWQLWKKNSWH